MVTPSTLHLHHLCRAVNRRVTGSRPVRGVGKPLHTRARGGADLAGKEKARRSGPSVQSRSPVSADGHDPARQRGLPAIGRNVSGARADTQTRSKPCSRKRLAAGAERVGASIDVTCVGCGDRFELSVRREYQHRRSGGNAECLTCRRPEVVMTEAEHEKYTAWWLYESGLDVDELIEIAMGFAGLSLWCMESVDIHK